MDKIDEILKIMERALYKVNAHEFLQDIFECGAIAISNAFDLGKAPQREEQYKTIMKKYTAELQKLIAEIFTEIYGMLVSQCTGKYSDYLGELYMRSDTSNKKRGQFFTPYNISKLTAATAIDKGNVKKIIEDDGIYTINEPSCGSAGMVIAMVDILHNQCGLNVCRNLLVECSDIDKRCVHMAYLQLGLAGIPAVVYQRNTLSMETWQRWETPAYIMQWLRFKDILKV